MSRSDHRFVRASFEEPIKTLMSAAAFEEPINPIQLEMCPGCPTPTHRKDLQRCGRCKTTWYCSLDHQRLDWPSHKRTCVATCDQLMKLRKPRLGIDLHQSVDIDLHQFVDLFSSRLIYNEGVSALTHPQYSASTATKSSFTSAYPWMLAPSSPLLAWFTRPLTTAAEVRAACRLCTLSSCTSHASFRAMVTSVPASSEDIEIILPPTCKLRCTSCCASWYCNKLCLDEDAGAHAAECRRVSQMDAIVTITLAYEPVPAWIDRLFPTCAVDVGPILDVFAIISCFERSDHLLQFDFGQHVNQHVGLSIQLEASQHASRFAVHRVVTGLVWSYPYLFSPVNDRWASDKFAMLNAITTMPHYSETHLADILEMRRDRDYKKNYDFSEVLGFLETTKNTENILRVFQAIHLWQRRQRQRLYWVLEHHVSLPGVLVRLIQEYTVVTQ